MLFTGRHLLPDSQRKLLPLLGEKTFHTGRPVKSVQLLWSSLAGQKISAICPGANTGYLRGQGYLLAQETSH